MTNKKTPKSKTMNTEAKPKKRSTATKKIAANSARTAPNAASVSIGDAGALFDRIAAIFEQARARVVRAANTEMILAYWEIGREIVAHLQGGSPRATYGVQLLDSLSTKLTGRFGRGYSATNLKYFRLFYQAYAGREPKIRHLSRDEFKPGRIRHESSDVSGALASSSFVSNWGYQRMNAACELVQQAVGLLRIGRVRQTRSNHA